MWIPGQQSDCSSVEIVTNVNLEVLVAIDSIKALTMLHTLYLSIN